MKVWNYVFIAITMMLFLQFAGFPTAIGGIFSFVNIEFNEPGDACVVAGTCTENALNSTDISFSNFFDYMFDTDDSDSDGDGLGLWASLLGIGIAAGLFATGKADIAIKAGFATAIFAAFVPTLYFSVTYAIEIGMAAWAVGLLAMIFVPLSVLFLFALVEYVVGGGTD